MGKRRKRTPEEVEVRLTRQREFRDLLERRRATDERLAAEAARRRRS